MAAMESIGMKVDGNIARIWWNGENDAKLIWKIRIYEKAGQSFNIKSPKQLGVVLLKIWEFLLVVVKKTDLYIPVDV